jgi:hypothetical protein
MIDLDPGKPGGWRLEGERLVPIAAEGPDVCVALEYTDPQGVLRRSDPSQWVRAVPGGSRLSDADGSPGRSGWVFAGSALLGSEASKSGVRYAADVDGSIIGVVSFGSETISWGRTWSPDTQTAGMVWYADPDLVPPMGTRVRVVIRLGKGD